MRPSPLRLYHASDLHGRLEGLDAAREPVEGWALTGDIFPDAPVGDVDSRRRHARAWFRRNTDVFTAAFGHLPVLVVDGNHDFEDLAACLREVGVDARSVTPRGLELFGRRFAGFPHIPWMRGGWAWEASPLDMVRLVRQTWDAHPEVLLTHCPPRGILDGVGATGHLGIEPLAEALGRPGHGVRHHLFGHVHEAAGRRGELAGVRYYNGALGVRLVELD